MFKHIPLERITPNPENPRKTFDEIGLSELAESIKQHGVLQPILVRPWSNLQDPENVQYQIVCGERRYRASKLAGIEEIPATIREMNAEEALEAMLMENFQRQDVHPIEEAVGFAALRLRNRMTPSQIATKVGKSTQYVVSRLKLAGLIGPLHRPFYEGRFDMKQALALSVLSEADQEKWLNDQDEDDDDWNAHYRIDKLTNELDAACFDINDPNLIKGAAACIGCQYNSKTSLLFDDGEPARCLNSICFGQKTAAMAMGAITAAREAGMTVITNYNPDKAVLKAIEGIPHFDSLSANYEQEPELNEVDPDDFDDADEFQEALAEAQREYDEEMKEWESIQNNPEYKKCLRVHDDWQVHYVYAKFDENSSSRSSANLRDVKVKDIAEKAAKGEATLVEKELAKDKIAQEITAAVDLCTEKVFTDLHQLYDNERIEGEEDEINERLNAAYTIEDHPTLSYEAKYIIFQMLRWNRSNMHAFVEGVLGEFPKELNEEIQDSNWYDETDIMTVADYLYDWVAGGTEESNIEAWNRLTTAWLRMFAVSQHKPQAGNKTHNASQASQLFIVSFGDSHYSASLKEIKEKHEAARDKKLEALNKQLEKLG